MGSQSWKMKCLDLVCFLRKPKNDCSWELEVYENESYLEVWKAAIFPPAPGFRSLFAFPPCRASRAVSLSGVLGPSGCRHELFGLTHSVIRGVISFFFLFKYYRILGMPVYGSQSWCTASALKPGTLAKVCCTDSFFFLWLHSLVHPPVPLSRNDHGSQDEVTTAFCARLSWVFPPGCLSFCFEVLVKPHRTWLAEVGRAQAKRR